MPLIVSKPRVGWDYNESNHAFHPRAFAACANSIFSLYYFWSDSTISSKSMKLMKVFISICGHLVFFSSTSKGNPLGTVATCSTCFLVSMNDLVRDRPSNKRSSGSEPFLRHIKHLVWMGCQVCVRVSGLLATIRQEAGKSTSANMRPGRNFFRPNRLGVCQMVPLAPSSLSVSEAVSSSVEAPSYSSSQSVRIPVW